MSESSDEADILTPQELRDAVKEAELCFLPEKSREKYLKAYEIFNKWRTDKGATNISETVLLSYLIELSHNKQPTTMWSIYSMLKATLKTKHNIHIETYKKLLGFPKRLSVGHKSKKSKVLTASNIEKFLNEAPDCNFLATKVILIMGCSGCSGLQFFLTLALLASLVVEPETSITHMINIYRRYNKAAEEANVLIISACGYGSIPGVMGFVHLKKHFNGTLQTVECYTEIEMPKRVYSLRNVLCGGDNCLVHFGTWNSLVHELKNFPEYFRMRKETFPEPIYGLEPEEIKKSFFHRKGGKTWFPYPGPDSNIIDMTQRYLHEKNEHKPVYFKMYTTMPLLIHLILIIPIFYCYYWLSYFKCFRSLLRRYPRFFTAGFMGHEGPNEENMHETKYSYVLSGMGLNKNETIHLKVSGSHPYEATAIAFIFSAITILRDNSRMPKGGVLTTGAAFYETELVERLNCHGIQFELISDSVVKKRF